MNVSIDEFFEEFRRWLALAIEQLGGSRPPFKESQKLSDTIRMKVKEDGPWVPAWGGGTVAVPDWFQHVLTSGPKLHGEGGTERLLAVAEMVPPLRTEIIAVARIKEGEERFSDNHQVQSEFLNPILVTYLERNGAIVNEAAIDEAIREVRQALFDRESIRCIWTATFHGMDTEIDEANLSDGVHLRLATFEESQHEYDSRRAMWSVIGSPNRSRRYLVLQWESAFDFPMTIPKPYDDDWKTPVDAFMLAARLVAPQWLALRTVDMQGSNRILWPRWSSQIYAMPAWRNVREGFGDGQYTVTQQIVEKIQKTWHQAQSAIEGPDDALREAILRLGDSYSRTRSSERLIDCWIGLEALFGHSNQELTQTLSMTIPFYLCSSQTERDVMRELVVASYDLRGKIAHGKTVDWNQQTKKSLTPSELLRLTREWLRNAIVKRLTELQGPMS